MIKVRVHRSVNEVMEIVRELRAHGMTQGSDFDFAYFQNKYDPITGHRETEEHAVFTFYVEKYATLFTLKWSS